MGVFSSQLNGRVYNACPIGMLWQLSQSMHSDILVKFRQGVPIANQFSEQGNAFLFIELYYVIETLLTLGRRLGRKELSSKVK